MSPAMYEGVSAGVKSTPAPAESRGLILNGGSSMDGKAMLRQQLQAMHNYLESAIVDCTPGLLSTRLPGATINSAATAPPEADMRASNRSPNYGWSLTMNPTCSTSPRASASSCRSTW